MLEGAALFFLVLIFLWPEMVGKWFALARHSYEYQMRKLAK